MILKKLYCINHSEEKARYYPLAASSGVDYYPLPPAPSVFGSRPDRANQIINLNKLRKYIPGKAWPLDVSYILSVPKFTANLYCICLSITKSILKQVQYRFAVNFGTLCTIFSKSNDEKN